MSSRIMYKSKCVFNLPGIVFYFKLLLLCDMDLEVGRKYRSFRIYINGTSEFMDYTELF